MQWLARREYGRWELARKLAGKGLARDDIEQALDELTEEGVLSDARLVESVARGHYAKGHGPMRIRLALREKGASRESLEECLAQYDWDELLERVYRKKYAEPTPAAAEYAARARFLLQRGFSQDSINALFRRLRRNDDSDL